MNSRQIDLVQSTFNQVLPIADDAAALFYGRLFELDPSLRPMFRGDLREQGKKLMVMLHSIVSNLRNLESILPRVRSLATRHVGYGVRDEHYDIVGAALLWTLAQGLGQAFTEEVGDAWVEAYTILATEMKDASREEAA
jgi:hemoglobin-like flavoprotein